MMQLFLRPIVAILAFVFGVIGFLYLAPLPQIQTPQSKEYSDKDVEFVSFCDLVERPALYDRHIVRVRARTGHGIGETGLYDTGGQGGKCGTNLSFVCGDSAKCRTVARYMDGNALIDLDLIVTGVFYSGRGPLPAPVLKITEINDLSEYIGPEGKGTGQGHGEGRGTGHGTGNGSGSGTGTDSGSGDGNGNGRGYGN